MALSLIRPEILYAWNGPSLLIVNARGECGSDEALSGYYFREARFLRTLILDINKDAFTVEGLSYGDPNLIELLQHLGAAFSPPDLSKLTRDERGSREYPLSRAWAWGAERSGG